MTLKSELEVTL